MAAKQKKEPKERTPEQQSKIDARVAKMIAAREAKKIGVSEAEKITEPQKEEKMSSENINQETENVSKSEFEQLKSLLLEQQKQIEELKKAPAPAAQPVYNQQIDRPRQKFGTSMRKEIDPADRLQFPKTYVLVGGGLVLSVYYKDGTEHYAPHDRPCIFKASFSEKRKMADGKDRDCIFSAFTTYSKKEEAFIENCPYYKTIIFSKTSEAMKVDYEALERLKAITDEIHRMSEVQLYSTAESYGIDIQLPADNIREQLKNIRIVDRMQYEQAETKRKVQELGLLPKDA